MITNERQYKITKSQLTFLNNAASSFDIREKTEQIGSEILAKAELDSLNSEIEILEKQIYDYENLKSSSKQFLDDYSLEELPKILIKARIAQNLSQKELARLLNLKEQQIQRYEAEEYQSASLKRLMEVSKALKLKISGTAKINDNLNSQLSTIENLDWKRFPIKDMYKRGWFDGFSGSLNEIEKVHEELLKNYINKFFKKPALALQRKKSRINSNFDQYALLAWECRVLHLAENVTVSKYYEELISSNWITELVKLSKYEDGPLRAKEMLEGVGMKLIVEPMLPKTYLDGAAILHSGTPIIGMTLRYDRIDNFWFVLLHEIFHVLNHLEKEKITTIFDDLDVNDTDKLEVEADEFARESLIPSTEWNKAIVRFTQSTHSVESFARRFSISPAIVAGRIRFETNNYTMLNSLIGLGQVRKLFKEVNFGM